MSVVYRIGTTFTRSSESLTSTKASTVGAEVVVSESFAVVTNQLVAFVLDVSQLKSFYMRASGGAMTVKTNSSGAPAHTFALLDGEAISWHSDSPLANPFGSTDVTALYVTNAGATTVLLDIRAGTDPTV